MTLVLRGRALEVRGLSEVANSEVLRTRKFDSQPDDQADAAVVRNDHELLIASKLGHRKVVWIGQPDKLPADPHTLVVLPSEFNYLDDGDIIAVERRTQRVRSLFRRTSSHNSFLVTERCNHNCLMCSQPPRKVDDQWIIDELRVAIPLVDSATNSFTFTGGETLSDWREFISLLDDTKRILPNTAIQVLTNGRAFASGEIADAWANVGHPDLIAAIPLYSAVDSVHDYVVQAPGAFDETILGILKLKERKQRVELRVVLHSITAPIIAETCRWFARNLPFVDHVALMGLENTGFAIGNEAMLWIDPLDYAAELANGVDALLSADVRVSIYNLPRCILPKEIWPNAVQSISDWKNGYLEECSGCVERPRCSGFFTSGRPRTSRGIRALQ